MFFELFADTGANERGPDLGASLPNILEALPCVHTKNEEPAFSRAELVVTGSIARSSVFLGTGRGSPFSLGTDTGSPLSQEWHGVSSVSQGGGSAARNSCPLSRDPWGVFIAKRTSHVSFRFCATGSPHWETSISLHNLAAKSTAQILRYHSFQITT